MTFRDIYHQTLKSASLSSPASQARRRPPHLSCADARSSPTHQERAVPGGRQVLPRGLRIPAPVSVFASCWPFFVALLAVYVGLAVRHFISYFFHFIPAPIATKQSVMLCPEEVKYYLEVYDFQHRSVYLRHVGLALWHCSLFMFFSLFLTLALRCGSLYINFIYILRFVL